MRIAKANAFKSLLVLTVLLLAAAFAAILFGARSALAAFGAYKAEAQLADVFPGADRFGPMEGTPKAAAAYKDGKLAGYVFETNDTGYSGKAIRILAGLDVAGTFTGAKVIEHHEPILLVGISPDKLFGFVARYAGRSIIEKKSSDVSKQVDVISGATVTAVVINDGLMRTALQVAKARGIAGFAAPGRAVAAPSGSDALTKRTLADVPFQNASWDGLLNAGLVRRLLLKNAQVDSAFAKIGVGSGEPYATPGKPEDDFIDLYLTLFSIETAGHSLLSPDDYAAVKTWLQPGESAVLIAASGDYSFRGSGFVRGGIFDRIQLIQDETTILFKDKDYRRIDRVAASGAPDFAEIGVFRIQSQFKFDPTRPFRLELLAQRPTGPTQKAFTGFSLPFEVPQAYIAEAPSSIPPPPAQVSEHVSDGAMVPPALRDAQESPSSSPLWATIWAGRTMDIAILGTALALLTLIFFFQDWLVKRPVLFARLRTSFLLFSVVWLGLYAKAQLSVVNVLTFANALITGFRWDFFLLEPLIFILWCAVAVSLLFWGRGAYCGWLCPFGSLQELLNHAARRLGIRQYTVPFYIHERIWALKYILFIGLLGLSLGDMATAERFAEIEPFKTVVLLRFMREWWFVLFALGLLTAGLFIERFYCRYLCVLGAAIAIPGRGRMFDWLKRRKQCGYECQLCAKNCMVQAIHPLGQINPNECLYCMHCQVIYHDDHACPPLIMKREGRGKKSAAKAPAALPIEEPVRKGPAAVAFTFTHKEKQNV